MGKIICATGKGNLVIKPIYAADTVKLRVVPICAVDIVN